VDLNDLSTPLITRTAAAISTQQNKQAFCSMNSTTYSQLPSERFGALRQYKKP